MLVSVNPYLSFNGSCEAAFNFYKSVFGGEFVELFRYKEKMGDETPESEKRKKHAHIVATYRTRLVRNKSLNYE